MKIIIAIIAFISLYLVGGEYFSYAPEDAVLEIEVDEGVVQETDDEVSESDVIEEQETEFTEIVQVVEVTREEQVDAFEDESLQELQSKLEEARKQAELVQSGIEDLNAAVVPAAAQEVLEIEETEVLSFTELVAVEVHRLTNVERAQRGFEELSRDAELDMVAEGHSVDMYVRDYFDHDSPEGCDITCRLEEAEYTAWAWGENIAWRKSIPFPEANELARLFMEGWMNSPGHKANILRESYTHHGVSIHKESNEAYITAVFSKPR